MIAAMTRDGRVIGKKGSEIPWNLPRDIERFRNYTAGKTLLIGRSTFEEMDGWFEKNQSVPIVLTSRLDLKLNSGHVASSVESAIEIAGKQNAAELVVCGGASVYEAALSFADELLLTLIDAKIDGDRHFPEFESPGDWTPVSAEFFPADSENEFAMTFSTLRRSKNE